MKISYNWLKEILPVKYSAEETAALLTNSGLEVEGIESFESIKGGLNGLVIGEVKTCIKHPDADKLKLTTVDVGSGEPYQIVCGGPNVAAGQKVVVALPGTKIFPLEGEPFVIKQAKIRGQASNGMICAEDEIGLGHSHEGVIVLPDDAKIGTLASDYYKIQSDDIFEIGLTPNRADAASHIGVARDLAAVIRTKTLIESSRDEKIPLKLPDPKIKEASGNKPSTIAVIVEDTNACPRYSGITIDNVKVRESPAWLRDRLSSIGVNPINNIVDITNFVLHECGQPLHAFDADQIKGRKIIVRPAKQYEKFVTLDHVERKLERDDLMICDESSPMCIAGVYGGLNSGITEKSKSVFIESAYFNPSWIRKTSKRHGLKTDASFRFERGTDPEITIYALKRAAQLMCEIAGGEVASPISDNYPSPTNPAAIDLKYEFLDKFSGEKIDRKIVKTILESLAISVVSESDQELKLKVPLFKVDVTRPADIVEEIMRVYGYDRVPIPDKIHTSIPYAAKFDRDNLQNKVSNYLATNGFHEIVTNSLTKGDFVTLPSWNEGASVKVLNPLSQELSVLRQDLLTSALEIIQYNANRKQSDLRLFEFGKTYHWLLGKYVEYYRFSLTLSGNREEASWNAKEKEVDFYFLKSFVNNLLAICGIDDVIFQNGESKSFGASLDAKKGNDLLASFGTVQKSILKKFDLSRDVLFADIRWDTVVRHARKNPVHYKEVSKFPAVKRDLSMLITNDISYAQLESIAYNAEKKILKNVSLFDVYEGDKVESGKKSYAMSFILQDDQQTLTEQQIGKVMERLMSAFETQAGAVIRRT